MFFVNKSINYFILWKIPGYGHGGSYGGSYGGGYGGGYGGY
jgi:hypothetical protein